MLRPPVSISRLITLNLCSPEDELLKTVIVSVHEPHPPTSTAVTLRRGVQTSSTLRTSVTETERFVSCASITSALQRQRPLQPRLARPMCS